MIHMLELVWGGGSLTFSFTNYPMTYSVFAGLAWPWPSRHTTLPSFPVHHDPPRYHHHPLVWVDRFVCLSDGHDVLASTALPVYKWSKCVPGSQPPDLQMDGCGASHL